MYTLYVENTHISQIHFYPNCDFDYYIFSLVTDEEIIISNVLMYTIDSVRLIFTQHY